MFEKLTQRAEGVASGLSFTRRGFLGRTGRRALVAAGAVGALLAAPTKARAGRPGYCHRTCEDACGSHKTLCYDACCLECILS
jgi:hypothetical protein